MQKKLIALAVAGLMSAPVMAQSNVQIYGIVDMGIAHSSSSDTGDFRSRTAIDQGLQSASRIGFRGTEDLGNGLTAYFTIEQGLAGERAGNVSNRQTFVGLRGGFGDVRLGRDWAPTRQFISSLDPFGAGTVGDVNAFYATQQRIDNAVIYTTPNMSGFKVSAAFSMSADDDNIRENSQEEATLKGNDRDNNRYWAITPTYNNGPISVGLGYSQTKNDAIGNAKLKTWDFGGSYDFGVVKLSALLGQAKLDTDGADPKVNQWLIGLDIPVSEAGNVALSYARQKTDFDVSGVSDAKANRWAIGYFHSLSKRTNLYAAYAKISTNSEAEGAYNVGVRDPDGDYTSGINLGIRHRF